MRPVRSASDRHGKKLLFGEAPLGSRCEIGMAIVPAE